jgi:fatty-acyl-CoA synthase
MPPRACSKPGGATNTVRLRLEYPLKLSASNRLHPASARKRVRISGERQSPAARETPDLHAVVALGEADPGSRYVHLASRLPSEDGPLDNPPAPGDIAALFHTGGTSGAPRLARHTHANHAFVVRAMAAALFESAVARIVNGLPLFHVAGSIGAYLSPLAAGGEVLIPTAAGLRNPEVVAGH